MVIARSVEIEAVIEMAIASFLDTEALGFADWPHNDVSGVVWGDKLHRIAEYLNA